MSFRTFAIRRGVRSTVLRGGMPRHDAVFGARAPSETRPPASGLVVLDPRASCTRSDPQCLSAASAASTLRPRLWSASTAAQGNIEANTRGGERHARGVPEVASIELDRRWLQRQQMLQPRGGGGEKNRKNTKRTPNIGDDNGRDEDDNMDKTYLGRQETDERRKGAGDGLERKDDRADGRKTGRTRRGRMNFLSRPLQTNVAGQY